MRFHISPTSSVDWEAGKDYLLGFVQRLIAPNTTYNFTGLVSQLLQA
jgi:hypothetical protein